MGQKVNPHGLRVGIIKDWDSKWYAKNSDYPKFLIEDFKIRKYVAKDLNSAGISRVYIDRLANKNVNVNIFAARPGFIVGKGGENIKNIKAELEKITKKEVKLDISEVANIDADAQIVSESIAQALEKRISFRRAMKQAISRAIRGGALGIKVMVSGRLNGAEIARSESYSEGNVPLSTLRANIDYGFSEADTTYGKLGIKVWIYLGEILPQISEKTRLVRKEARVQKPKNAKPANKRRRPEGAAGTGEKKPFKKDNRKPRNDRNARPAQK